MIAMRPRTALIVLACALAPAARARGDEPRPADPAPAGAPAADSAAPRPLPEAPYAGTVSGEGVNLRAGPGTSYEALARLAPGERVLVVGETFGWLRVRAVDRRLRVYVHKELVAPKGGGALAVERDRVNLRARPALDATVVGQADRGDLLRLVEDAGEWAAVEPPASVAFYVHGELIRPAAAGPGVGTGPVPGPAAAPHVDLRPRAAGDPPGRKVRRAHELYLAEVAKDDLDLMDFGPALRLFEEALREVGPDDPETRRAALDGLERVQAAEALRTGCPGGRE